MRAKDIKTLVLMSRPGCERCDALEDALDRHFRGAYRLDWRNVDRDEIHRARYGESIPVLLGEHGVSLSVGALDRDRVEQYLGRDVGPV